MIQIMKSCRVCISYILGQRVNFEHIESALQHERQMAILANTPMPFLDEA